LCLSVYHPIAVDLVITHISALTESFIPMDSTGVLEW
jgi:hypothetical protein